MTRDNLNEWQSSFAEKGGEVVDYSSTVKKNL